MMRALLVEIGVGPLPTATAPLTIASTWVPVPYTPPPLAVPTGLASTAIADGALIAFTPTPGTETVIEIAPDSSGAPGTWNNSVQTAASSYTLPLSNGAKRWVRLKAVKNGRSSAYTAALLVSSINVTQVQITGGNALANTVTNGVVNGAFEADLYGWLDAFGGGLTGWYTDSGGILGSKQLVKFQGANGTSGIFNDGGGLAVQPGQSIEVRIAVISVAAPAGSISFGLAGYNAAGAAIEDVGGWNAAGTIVAADCASIYKVFRKVVKITNAAVVKVRAAFAVRDYTGTGAWAFDSVDIRVLPSSIDEVPDGAGYARTRTAVVQNGVVRGIAFGANLIPNPNFADAIGTVPNTYISGLASLCDNWSADASGGTYFNIVHESGQNLLIRFLGSATLPASSGYHGATVYSQSLDVEAARKYRLLSAASNSRNATPPAAFEYLHRVAVNWYTVSGGYITTDYHDFSLVGSFTHDNIYTSPANASKAQIYLQSFVRNTSGSPIGPAGALWADMRWYGVSLKLVTDIDSELGDGASFSRVSNTDLVGNRMGMRVAGSGQKPANQFNLHSTTIGSIRSRWDGLSITYSVPTTGSPATVTIDASAATLRSGSASVNYSASSVQVSQARSTTVTYQLYYLDATPSGGSRTLNATTDANVLANTDDVIWVGALTVIVPAAGTGSSGGGDPGGGCVVIDAVMADGRTAAEWRIGDVSPCWALEHGFHSRPCLAAAAPMLRPCVRLVVASGHSITLSADTPVDCPNSVLAPDMLGRSIFVSRGEDVRSEHIVRIDDVGWRWVVPLSFDGCSFPAGDSAEALFFTHNVNKP